MTRTKPENKRNNQSFESAVLVSSELLWIQRHILAWYIGKEPGGFPMATIPEAFAIAIQHHQAGRLQAAEQIYRQILAVEPDQPDALHLLGVIAAQVGKHEVAVEYIGRAITLKGNAFFHNNLGEAYRALRRISEAVACYHLALNLKPDFAEAHSNLGIALRDQGKLDEAITCWRRALELKPGFADVHNSLGNALKGQGKLDEAIACYRRALELKPDFTEAHINLGNALRDQGKLDEAVACYRRTLQFKPDFAAAHSNLGVALMEQGQLDEALACYRRALELKPDFAEAHINLGNALREQGRLDEALVFYHRALDLKPDYAEAHVNLGNALNDQGTLDEALACYRRALDLKPDYAAAHSSLGGALEEKGDLHGAEDSFRSALRHNTRFAFAHYKLANLLGGVLPASDLAAQCRLLEEMKLTDAQQLLLHFGLAKVLDARGEYAEAAEHLVRGNALQLSQWRKRGKEYDPKEHESFVTQMIMVCTPDFFARVRGFGLETELPVFVVGLPRSGTTLIEQILASHSRVFGAGEIKLVRDTMAALGGQGAASIEGLRQLNREMAQRLASRHLERLRALDPAAIRIVNKMPENYLSLGLLASLFPRAKFIHCRRDLRDVAVSCWMTHFREVRWANDQQHIVSRFCEYQRMMEHWRKVLPVPLLEVDYEKIVADLEGVARRLVGWCGLEWEPRCLEFYRAERPVVTASAVQVRQPLFKTSVGRWKNYEQSLATLLGALPGGQ
ncbi:MAG: tetratricopeptide repeat protein [Thermoguttaceae bacterium]